MHILFITGEYPPQPGGVGAYTAELGQALLAQGVQVSVLTSQKVDQQIKLPIVAPLNGVAIYPVIPRWDWRIWRTVPAWAAKLAVDWVHVQYQTAAFAMHPAINLAPGRWRAYGYPAPGTRPLQRPIGLASQFADALKAADGRRA